MTQVLADTTRIDPIRQTLEWIGQKRRAFVWLARLLRSASTWLALGLVVVLIDATWPIPGSLRLAVVVTLAVALAVVLILSRPHRDDPQRQPLQDARTLEHHHGLRTNPLINALWLAALAEQKDPSLAGQLAKRSVQQGHGAMDRVDADVLIDRESARRETGWLWMVAVVWVVACLIQPRLITGGLLRFVNPFGDHPPISLTEFDVRIDPEQAIQGDDVTVWAALSGKVPPTADLVEVNNQGKALRRWPMRGVEAGQFERRLLSVREPITFQIEANGARSKRFSINPSPRPPPPLPEAQDNRLDEQDDREPQAAGDDTSVDPQMSGRLDDPDLVRLVEALEALADEAQQIRKQSTALVEQARQAEADGWDRQKWQQFVDPLQQLDQRVQAFRQEAQALAAQCRALADQKDAQGKHEVAKALRALADLLEHLSLCEGGACPNPGEGFKPGTGLGSGFGFGHGGVSDDGTLGGWLLRINADALVDTGALDAVLGRLLRALLAGSGGTQGDAQPGPDQPRATTAYHEWTGESDVQTDQPDAIMQQVPPRYRDLVSRYFDRLNEAKRAGE
ncbi:MAG: hypothetical protein V3U29_06545 [Phycisphaeraceae bacterium]